MSILDFLPSPEADSIVFVCVIALAVLIVGLWLTTRPKGVIIILTVLQGVLAWVWSKLKKDRQKKSNS